MLFVVAKGATAEHEPNTSFNRNVGLIIFITARVAEISGPRQRSAVGCKWSPPLVGVAILKIPNSSTLEYHHSHTSQMHG